MVLAGRQGPARTADLAVAAAAAAAVVVLVVVAVDAAAAVVAAVYPASTVVGTDRKSVV